MSYTYAAASGMAVRSSDGASVPWDGAHDRPLDMEGEAGARWIADGSPASVKAPAPPPPVPQITSKQVTYALNHLGLRVQWDAAWAGQKQDDRDWFTYGGDPFPVDHKRIVRMLGVAGVDAGKVTAQAQVE